MTMVDTQTHAKSEGPRTDRIRSRRALGEIVEAYALLILLVVTAIFFTLYPATADTFPTVANIRILVGNQAVIAIVALAALIPLVANQWDLSIGAIAGLVAVLTASWVSDGSSIGLAILLGVLVGAATGSINALIITRGRVNAVIATLGMATMLAGVITQKTGGMAVVGAVPAAMTDFGSGNWVGVPRTAFALAAVAAAVYYMLEYTPFGRYLYALGSNPAASKLVGLRTRLILGVSFVMAGGLSAIGGIIQVARAGGADPRVGDAFTLPALAAAFLSAAAIRPGKYNVGGTLTAIFFLAVINNGLNLAGAPSYLSSYINGGALIVGVGLAAYLGRKRSGTE
jgi:ribose transport system permease protein